MKRINFLFAIILCIILLSSCKKPDITESDANALALEKVKSLVNGENDKILAQAREGYSPGICVGMPREGCIPYLENMRDSFEFNVTKSRAIGEKWNIIVSIHNGVKDKTDYVEAKVYSASRIEIPDLEQ